MESTKQGAVLITGASGFIGQGLARSLLADGYEVWGLSRKPEKAQRKLPEVRWIGGTSGVPDSVQLRAVVNLAGAPILDKRWSEKRKDELMRSRTDTTEQLVAWLKARAQKPEVLVSGSAIGFYGAQPDDRVLLESDDGRQEFTHHLCQRWEELAQQAESAGIRVCAIRTGVVLGRGGGALARMLPPFRLGLGGPIASGRQWFSWIHLDDEVRAIRFLMDHEVLSGPFNLTAPEPVTNRTFTRALGRALNRPTIFPMPGWVLRLMLGEGAVLLTEGQRVMPARLQEAGFEFSFPTLESALQDVIG